MPRKYGLSPTGNPLTKFVNLHQTNEERAEKYWLVRSYGWNFDRARRLRDWRLCRIEWWLAFHTPNLDGSG